MYDTVNNSPILLSYDFGKRPGMLAGRVILVDRGHEYVVSRQMRDEDSGNLRKCWTQGNYFGIGYKSRREALADALKKYDELVEKV